MSLKKLFTSQQAARHTFVFLNKGALRHSKSQEPKSLVVMSTIRKQVEVECQYRRHYI